MIEGPGTSESSGGVPRAAPRSAEPESTEPASAGTSRSRRWRERATPWLLWIGGGVLMALPHLFDPLEWAQALVAIPWIVAARRLGRHAFLWGWLGGIAFVFTGLTWLHEVGTLGVALAALYFGAYVGVFAVVAGPVARSARLPAWVSAPIAVVAMETACTHLTIFEVTWLYPGYTAWRLTPLVQVVELGGISAVSALLFLLAGALVHAGSVVRETGAVALRSRATWLPLVVAALALLAAWGWGAWRLARLDLRDGLRVALVQGNVPQSIRLRPENAGDIVRKHAAMTRSAAGKGVDLVAWPESSVNAAPEAGREARLRAFLGRTAREVGAPIVIGALGLNPDRDPPAPSNSAFLVGLEGQLLGRADKRILVPGAETLLLVDHVPPLRDAISDLLSRTMGFRPYLVPGEEAVAWDVAGHRVGILICYGDLVPRPARELARAGADTLVTISNEAWFGSRELDQHLAMATARCIETRLPMARSTNTGLTCLIDPAGRVVEALPRDEDGVLVGTLPVTSLEPVPPWIRAAFAWSLTAIAAALFLAHAFTTLRRRRQTSVGISSRAGSPGRVPPRREVDGAS